MSRLFPTLFSFFLLFAVSIVIACAQEKEIEYREQTWLGYFNQTRITNKSGLWVDLHARFTDQFVNRLGISIARVGYIYYITDQVRLSSGYAYVTQHGHGGTPNVPEHRPWQQIQWIEKKKGFTLMQWIRVEERFRRNVTAGELTDEYNFNWRFRYNIAFTIPLKGKSVAPRTPFLFLNNEIHINAGKEIARNYFDQNRLFAGVGYQFTAHINAHLGYMFVFQQLPEANKFVHTDAIRLFVFHNIEFHKKE